MSGFATDDKYVRLRPQMGTPGNPAILIMGEHENPDCDKYYYGLSRADVIALRDALSACLGEPA